MADTILAEYGRPLTVDFELWQTDGTDFQTGAVHASGDTTILRDGAAQVNTTNGFVDEGTGYSITLTAAEMAMARGKVYVVDQGTKQWLDKALRILTHSHPLAHDPRGVIAGGTAQAGAADSITLAAAESAINDFFAGGVVEIIAGTGVGQTPRAITVYDGTTKVATIEPNWVVNPDATSVYRVIGAPPSPSIENDVTQALTDFSTATTVNTDALSVEIQNVQLDVDNIQTRLPAALSTSGRMASDIQSIKDHELTATPPFDTV